MCPPATPHRVVNPTWDPCILVGSHHIEDPHFQQIFTQSNARGAKRPEFRAQWPKTAPKQAPRGEKWGSEFQISMLHSLQPKSEGGVVGPDPPCGG